MSKTRTTTDLIIIHCSYTPPSMDVGVETIREWHLARGWSDIGYHYVIRRDGPVEEGRQRDLQGAHTKGQNYRSVGVCLIGGKAEDGDFDEFNYTQKQMVELEALVLDLADTYPGAQVAGHNEFSDKDCPCFNVPAWWTFGDVVK